MRRLMTASFLGMALLSMIALAADISGTWSATVDLGGQGGTATFNLQQKGDKLTGTYSGALGSADVTGTVQGNKVEWSFTNDHAGKVTYTGTLEGSQIKGTCSYGEIGKGTFVAEKK